MCFQAIDGGFPQDALVDMTGALGEEVRIQELLFDDQLWKRMMKSNDKEFGPLLTAGIMGRNPDGSEAKLDTGLFGGHAYSITAVREVQKGMSRHNTSHIIKRTGKMIIIDRNNAFSGLKFDTEVAKMLYFCKPGKN